MFNTGPVYMTQGAQELIPVSEREKVIMFLGRHTNGDYGDIDAEDKKTNDDAVKHQSGMVLSNYTDLGERLWIITNFAGPETYTTLLKPNEY